ncbi:dTMP kinase [Patescibacteria group bacterium]|nr:dTMP kinase [Patescibacteria group bacterium]MBU4017446.1 dTMP kinase [Patescibacteria group bacterium]MBU4099177.1 dTMP kinase [Patescibacteria group bacterium]
MKYHVEFDIDLRRNSYKGLYIALEGIDGSGKTTQLQKLYNYFQKRGRGVIKTREPRKQEGIIGELIQKILHGKTQIPPVAFQYLFSADREMHHEELVIPSLQAGKVVISDRCFWSAIPYGLLDRKSQLDENTIEYLLAAQSILSMYHQFIVPDNTFYLDIPLDVAIQRIDKTSEEKEIYEDKEKLEKTIKGYQWLLREFPKEFTIIDATKRVEEVTEEIVEVIKSSSHQVKRGE